MNTTAHFRERLTAAFATEPMPSFEQLHCTRYVTEEVERDLAPLRGKIRAQVADAAF